MTQVGDSKPCTYRDCDGTMEASAVTGAGFFGESLPPLQLRWRCNKNTSHVDHQPENQT